MMHENIFLNLCEEYLHPPHVYQSDSENVISIHPVRLIQMLEKSFRLHQNHYCHEKAREWISSLKIPHAEVTTEEWNCLFSIIRKQNRYSIDMAIETTLHAHLPMLDRDQTLQLSKQKLEAIYDLVVSIAIEPNWFDH